MHDPRPHGDAQTTRELIALGRIGVDLYPETPGPLAGVERFAKSLGGSAANVAVAAARLGHTVALATRVGDDALGRYLVGALRTFAVDTTWVGIDRSLPTPVVIAELDPPEDPGLSFYRWPKAPDLELELRDLDRGAIERCGILWVTGTGLSAEPSRMTTLAVLEWSSCSSGGERILDLDVRPQLWAEPGLMAGRLREAIVHATIVVGNRMEVEVATGSRDPEDAARRMLELGVRIAIVKLGSDGVLVCTGDGIERVDPIAVPVVCGLGAGDAFGGALCHGVLEGWKPERTVRFANAAGAIVASRLACADAMPTREEIEEVLEHGSVR